MERGEVSQARRMTNLCPGNRVRYTRRNVITVLPRCHARKTWQSVSMGKISAKVISHGRYITFQLVEVVVTKELFRKIL